MSTLLPQYYPEDFGAGSGLIWLGDAYTYEQVSSMWPNVRWSYLYSGITQSGELSELSMIVPESAAQMETYWAEYSGMYIPGCSAIATPAVDAVPAYWVTGFLNPATSYLAQFMWSGTAYVYSGCTLIALASGESYEVAEGEGCFWKAQTTVNDHSYTYATGPTTLTNSGAVDTDPKWIVYSGSFVDVLVNVVSGLIPTALQYTYNGSPGFYMIASLPIASGYVDEVAAVPATFDYVIETAHTYSGAPEDAWRSWTQDEAAIMEAYERTISGGQSDYAITSSNPSGIAIQGLDTPPLFTIHPGNYNVSYGHIWFYNTCNIDARSARFFANRKTGQHVGYSPTWRCPTGDEAKAVITIGSDAFVQCPHLGGADSSHEFHDYVRGHHFQKCDVYLPEVIAQYPVDDHFGVYDGAGIRMLAMYNVKIRNITTRGAFRYAVIFSPDSDGASYNDFHFGSNYKFLTGIKFRIRNGREQGGWFNNSIFWGGMWQQATPATGWDPDANPTVMFDNDNSTANPNRDIREDGYLDIDTGVSSYKQFVSIPSFWTDNFGTETLNIVHFIRASGWVGVTMRKGRFEGQDTPIIHPDTGAPINRTWWLTGQVQNNFFEDTVSQAALNGIPRQYIGNGIDFAYNGIPIPGFSNRARYTRYKYGTSSSNVPGDNNSTHIMSHDLYLATPGANIVTLSSNGEKLRALYIDEFVDTETSRHYPVVKARTIPHAWVKWKLSTEDTYTQETKTYPIGSTLHFKFGDFESLPDYGWTGSYVPYVRPYIQIQKNDGNTYTVYPSGLVNGIAGLGTVSTRGIYRADNANVINDSYAEIGYTFNESGIIKVSCWQYGWVDSTTDVRRFDEVEYGYVITIS